MTRDELVFALERIAVNAKRAGDIISHLRGFIRKDESSAKRSDINQLISEAMDLVNSELLHLEINVELELTEGMPDVMVDPVQIQQVILNLVRNSMEAIDSHADDVRNITIATLIDRPGRIKSHSYRFRPWIGAEIAEKIFDAFMSTKSEGMGIGLSICKSIVEAHGGELITKQQSGRGATFSFVLPSISEGGEHDR